ncbi:DUF1997 domain-containing protein [Leptothoe sp. PORK10 BA2]|uniref:DUF1997 domain-containing protein n=1 Tax=Leptothoe sp. PORK10 BA2 TaxID=3110254 RepID=UPI002B1F8604|nr:DUF1997 domain-containing protein [Leptothoe sp. PORK10 BA2]MEA5464434.1 DUF1997 domain-containing protein [Leptothoe sp. PORK10 BA2]
MATTPEPSTNAGSENLQTPDIIVFEGYYVGNMEMFADIDTVANYLDSHQGWFSRCAQPMDVKPIGHNGYAISLGRFGSLNFQVQPKIGLHLLPQNEGVYRIETIPVPGHEPEGYDVDFKAAMSLAEKQLQELPVEQATHVQWELNLQTKVQMPKFIQALPQSLVKASGDRLLNQIVKQISKRLTRKVQEDFHTMMNLPLPGRSRRR